MYLPERLGFEHEGVRTAKIEGHVLTGRGHRIPITVQWGKVSKADR